MSIRPQYTAAPELLPQSDPSNCQVATPAISKQLIRQRFDKASQSYQSHNGVQKRIADALLQIMKGQVAPRSAAVLLDLGCGPGPNWRELDAYCNQYVGIDLSSAMLNAHQSRQFATPNQQSHLLQADMESLPLANASVDTLYSSMAMQWAASRPGLCNELQRIMKPGADAFFSVPLQGSLQPLAQIRHAVDGQDQVNHQPTMDDWLDAVKAAGYSIVYSEQRCFSDYFSDLKSLLQSIKGVGAGANQALPLTRQSLRELACGYENMRTERGLPLHYQVGLLHIKQL